MENKIEVVELIQYDSRVCMKCGSLFGIKQNWAPKKCGRCGALDTITVEEYVGKTNDARSSN